MLPLARRTSEEVASHLRSCGAHFTDITQLVNDFIQARSYVSNLAQASVTLTVRVITESEADPVRQLVATAVSGARGSQVLTQETRATTVKERDIERTLRDSETLYQAPRTHSNMVVDLRSRLENMSTHTDRTSAVAAAIKEAASPADAQQIALGLLNSGDTSYRLLGEL